MGQALIMAATNTPYIIEGSQQHFRQGILGIWFQGISLARRNELSCDCVLADVTLSIENTTRTVQHWLYWRREQWEMISGSRRDEDRKLFFGRLVLCIQREGSEFATWRALESH